MSRAFSIKKTAGAMALVLALPLVFPQSYLEDTARSENSTMRSANAGFAEEEFRRGVQSYYRGAFNEAILEFERSLSYLPGENLILDWLGKAYYRAGIEGAALQQWNFAAEAGYGGILLQNRIEIVGERRITEDSYGFNQRYTESGSYPYMNGKTLIYSQPTSSLSNTDGSIWVVAYGSNELLRYDVNGVVVQRVRGPLNGFDRPLDIMRLKDGNLLISESAGDRLCVMDGNGLFVRYIGGRGCGEGELVGPQYLAQDSYGNIYTTDFGNARVVVFDSEGNGLLHFGGRSGSFKGLESPTGIAVVRDRVFVADSVRGAVYEFDRAGNFISTLVNEGTFTRAESMKEWGGYLLVADMNRVVTVDTLTGAVFENARTGSAPGAITSAVPDVNGNLIVTDFKNNEIYVMAKMSELVGGFFVTIERVIADNFPSVILEVRVENRRRQQVVGLRQENFLITEGKRPVANMELMGAANNNDVADITIIIDRSVSMESCREQLTTAVREVAASMQGKGTIQIISASDVPVKEFSGNPRSLEDFTPSVLKAGPTDLPRLDLGIRLAANDLVNAEKKCGIIYLTDGAIGQTAFAQYGLSDLATYLNNNSVSFSTIMLSRGTMAQEVSYITENTRGRSYYVYRPEGLSSVIQDIIDLPSGLYQLRYDSALTTEYGRKYLPVEVETYLLNRSGRDETGYFAPLQ